MIYCHFFIVYMLPLLCKYCCQYCLDRGKLNIQTEIVTYSPRANRVLFTFLRPKGLNIVSIVEFYDEFENAFLKKISTEFFP